VTVTDKVVGSTAGTDMYVLTVNTNTTAVIADDKLASLVDAIQRHLPQFTNTAHNVTMITNTR